MVGSLKVIILAHLIYETQILLFSIVNEVNWSGAWGQAQCYDSNKVESDTVHKK